MPENPASYRVVRTKSYLFNKATAGWISLFTLHAIWPFLWIWATLYREDRGWGMQNHITKPDEVPGMDALAKRVAELEQKLAAVQPTADKNTLER
ncbi:MAG: DUF3302 domain-containing protein [Enterobacter roggenkampii]